MKDEDVSLEPASAFQPFLALQTVKKTWYCSPSLLLYTDYESTAAWRRSLAGC